MRNAWCRRAVCASHSPYDLLPSRKVVNTCSAIGGATVADVSALRAAVAANVCCFAGTGAQVLPRLYSTFSSRVFPSPSFMLAARTATMNSSARRAAGVCNHRVEQNARPRRRGTHRPKPSSKRAFAPSTARLNSLTLDPVLGGTYDAAMLPTTPVATSSAGPLCCF